MKHCILFISLAGNQSRFFLKIGQSLAQQGIETAHVCFHESSVQELRKAGATAFNPFDYQSGAFTEIDFEQYAIKLPGLLLGHEKAAYELSDTQLLADKFKKHLAAMSRIIDTLLKEYPDIILVQELGGFTSVLAAFFAARHKNINNWFIEPSFFKGRVFFTPNKFSAPEISNIPAQASENVQQIITNILKSQSVVIPQKDKSHYRGAGLKLADSHNIKRLLQKLTSKYVLGQREEFEHIGGHINRHLRMFINSQKLKLHYKRLPTDKPIIYYPFHVPADFALTIRSPEYLNQYAIIDFICRCAPFGWQVVIKEHPALIGAINPQITIDLLKKHDNLILLHPSINNHEVLSNAHTIVTVNSKTGAEALLYQKRVFALGDSFYKDSALVNKIHKLAELPELLSSPTREIQQADVLSFFQGVWNSSYPGELYDISPENIQTFTKSLLQCINFADSKTSE
ncbi:hypothetical protein [Methylophilus methylotrophus]|uniref:capsular polysaccharide export protein, LipB/KpsS family n=1 Tax=Methylophilus methylotrophus TaxID=17 RepID=UPI000F591A64|nr:hypothetical protein [Methylophilus methylotrophus]